MKILSVGYDKMSIMPGYKRFNTLSRFHFIIAKGFSICYNQKQGAMPRVCTFSLEGGHVMGRFFLIS